jgi:hypothetical protein
VGRYHRQLCGWAIPTTQLPQWPCLVCSCRKCYWCLRLVRLLPHLMIPSYHDFSGTIPSREDLTKSLTSAMTMKHNSKDMCLSIIQCSFISLFHNISLYIALILHLYTSEVNFAYQNFPELPMMLCREDYNEEYGQ